MAFNVLIVNCYRVCLGWVAWLGVCVCLRVHLKQVKVQLLLVLSVIAVVLVIGVVTAIVIEVIILRLIRLFICLM